MGTNKEETTIEDESSKLNTADRESAVHIANHAAGVVVGKRGTATVTVEEIQAQLPHKPGPGSVSREHSPRLKPRPTS